MWLFNVPIFPQNESFGNSLNFFFGEIGQLALFTLFRKKTRKDVNFMTVEVKVSLLIIYVR